MENEKKQQAKHLYFQTDLTKTQIAGLLSISRRSLHYWIREGNWERLKFSAKHLPSLLAENVYQLLGQLTRTYLSERRITNPITNKEADTLHKLTLTVNKLKNRTTLNENMETFAYFLDGLKKANPGLADQVAPYIDDYLGSRASVYISHTLSDEFTEMGRLPFDEDIDYNELRLDQDDIFDWETEATQTDQQSATPPEAAPLQNETQPVTIAANPSPEVNTLQSEPTQTTAVNDLINQAFHPR